MAAASYVTGSHAIKSGVTMGWGTNSRTFSSNARDQPVGVQHRQSARRGRDQRSGDRGTARQQRRRIIRTGYVDHATAHAECRRALRSLQCGSSGAVVARRHLDYRARLPSHQGRPQLERLVGSTRGCVRPVRQRQDGSQGQCEQVHRLCGCRIRAEFQRDDVRDFRRAVGETSMAIAASSMRPATSSSTK